MLRVYDTITRVARSDTSVVIRGESGTGKELVAKSIVAISPRKDKPFISLNCAALPDSLIESELFGYEKRRFHRSARSQARPDRARQRRNPVPRTDSDPRHRAPDQAASRPHRSTSVPRLGGSVEEDRFRLLTATNENLEEMVQAGRFREDLYYRIHACPSSFRHSGSVGKIFPCSPIISSGLLRINRIPGQSGLTRKSGHLYEDYNWPGNVREMENLI